METKERILFLDIDGVLNGSNFFNKSIYRKILIKLFHIRSSEPKLMFSKINLHYLKKLCRKYPDIKVVISSSWKFRWNINGSVRKSLRSSDISNIQNEKIDNLLRKECGCNIIGVVPKISTLKYKPHINYSICDGLIKTNKKFNFSVNEKYFRGAYILSWLVDNNKIFHFIKEEGEDRYKYEIDKDLKICILEDDYIGVSCFNDLKPHVVVTKFYGKKYGFRKEHYKKAVELLK